MIMMGTIHRLILHISSILLCTYQITVIAGSAPTIDTAKTTSQATLRRERVPRSGTSFSFKCVATGDPSPSYQWTKDGQTIDLASDSRLSLSNGILTIKSLNRTKDDGLYQCKATNTNGRDVSEVLNFKVGVIGKFLSPCTSVDDAITINATIGSPLLVNCPPVSYTYPKFYFWAFSKGQARPEELPLNEKRTKLTNGSLYFSYIEEADITLINNKGGVRCMISSSGIELQSCPFKLNKIQGSVKTFGPKFIEEISGSAVVLENSKQSFYCAASGNPSPKMTWYKDDKQLSSSSGYQFKEANFRMVINTVNRTQAGTYKCVAKSVYPNQNTFSVNATATLIVEYPPSWKEQLKDVTEFEGVAVTLKCNADGLPAPTYEWFKSGTKLTSGNLPSDVSINKGTLTIGKLSQLNGGTYQCAAVNKHATIYTASTITVQKIPTTLPSTTTPTTPTTTKKSTSTMKATSKRTEPTSKESTKLQTTPTTKPKLPPKDVVRSGCSTLLCCLNTIILGVFVTLKISW